MFSKALTVCVVLCAVQVYAGSVKPQLSAQVQEVVEKIDIAALLIENDLKLAAVDKKHEQDMAKQNIKMAIKQLKQTVKESKGSDVLCEQIANLEVRTVEKRADDTKLCNNKLNIKELQRDLNGYLKSLHGEALLVDKYCPFMHSNAEEAAQCVTDSVIALEAKLNDVETVINSGLAEHLRESSACIKSVVEDVQMESARIQIELAECLNPTTAALEKTEVPTQDSSSESSQSCKSKESKESDESGSGNSEVSDTTAGDKNEGSDQKNNSGKDNDEEQTSESSDNKHGSNDSEGTTDENVEDGNNNKTETGDAPVEEHKPVEDTPGEEEKLSEDAPAEEEKPAKNTPVKDASIVEEKLEQQSEIKNNDEINIEY